MMLLSLRQLLFLLLCGDSIIVAPIIFNLPQRIIQQIEPSLQLGGGYYSILSSKPQGPKIGRCRIAILLILHHQLALPRDSQPSRVRHP
ncbi:hypothetical protein BDW59DRAFT_66947 [Aspergillus cavernicola]|uniref:Secreted protein n=1 Tax=Aspergillus cavernicola TaxID=176166 RepID=A0ABR4IEA6_9EURO